jgi:hypothetical protein
MHTAFSIAPQPYFANEVPPRSAYSRIRATKLLSDASNLQVQ